MNGRLIFEYSEIDDGILNSMHKTVGCCPSSWLQIIRTQHIAYPALKHAMAFASNYVERVFAYLSDIFHKIRHSDKIGHREMAELILVMHILNQSKHSWYLYFKPKLIALAVHNKFFNFKQFTFSSA